MNSYSNLDAGLMGEKYSLQILFTKRTGTLHRDSFLLGEKQPLDQWIWLFNKIPTVLNLLKLA